MPENRDRYVVVCQQLLALATVLAVAVPAATVVPLDIVSPAPAVEQGVQQTDLGRQPADGPTGAGEQALVASAPVTPTVRTVPLAADLTGRASDQGGTAAGRAGQNAQTARLASAETDDGYELAALSAPEAVDGFTTVGVTWDEDSEVDEDDIVVSVRTRDGDAWSDWQDIEYHDDHGPDSDSAEAAHVRAGTEPILVGEVDQVQVRVETTDGSLPVDAEVSVIDPGTTAGARVEEPAIDTSELEGDAAASLSSAPTSTTSTTDPAAPADPATPLDPTVPATDPVTDDGILSTATWATPKPQIYSRAQWGANEKMRDGSPSYYEVHAGFVHHTVNANSYSKADVPALIRGIYAYHTQSRGWSDVGYNFIVDRFGRIWEGRAGGVDRPVVGAHTLGYNEYSFAMSALGNFDTARPPAAMVDAYGRLFAWKLSLHGVQASSTSQRVGSRTFQAVNGHRDAGSTACPGRHLYAQLPEIRRLAATYQAPFTGRTRSANLAGTPWPDVVVRQNGTGKVLMVRTGGQIGFQRGAVKLRGWKGKDLITAAEDVTGDGIGDLVARDGRTGVSSIYPGTLQGGFGPASLETERFAGLDVLEAVGDLTGDGNNDLVGRVAETKELYVYPGNGKGNFSNRDLLAADWSKYSLTAGAGDLTGDRRHDLVARMGKALYLFPGTAKGLGTPVLVPGAWGHFDTITGRGDLTGDGQGDLLARTRKSRMTFIYPGNGQGGFATRLGPYANFRNTNFISSVGNLVGDASVDVVARDRRGRIRVYPNTGGKNIESVTDTGIVARAANLLLNVGDWNGDGYGDLMTRSKRSGAVWFYAGNGQGRFAAPVRAATKWGRVKLVAAVGDITGDGFPDLMGQPRGSAMRIYPGDGSTGFGSSFVAHRPISSTAQTGIGFWDGDGSPDSLVRRGDGAMLLYRGNGPGGLTSPVKVGGIAKLFDWWQAIGDADGNGRPDLIARRSRDGSLWLVPGTRKGFAPPRLIATGFADYNLVG